MRTADTPTAIDKATKHSSSSAHNPTPACDSTPTRAASHTAGQVVFLTGASSGIGKSTAIMLHNAGLKVYAAARRVECMQDLRALGIVVLYLDLLENESIEACVQEVLHQEGRIDVFVSNAGYGFYGAIEDVPLESARAQLDVNLFGFARLVQLIAPSMRAQNHGKIIAISSIAGRVWTPFGGWYHASKYALEGLCDSLRLELKPFGVDVILIEPGGIKTDWGVIAARHLREIGGNGAYAKSCEKYARALHQTYQGSSLSSPDTIARTIITAIRAKRPKTRYLVGFMARPMLYARRVLGDRLFDRLIAFAWGRSW